MNLPAGDGNLAREQNLGDELAHALNLSDMASPVNARPREEPQDPNPASDPPEDPNAAENAAEGAPEDDSGEQQGDETEGSEIRKFTDLTAMFPEEQEVTAEDLYGLELVTSSDGKTLTVGELKDMYQQRADFEAEKARFAEEQTRKTQELEEMRQQAQAQTGEFQQLPQELQEAQATVLAIRQQAQSQDWKSLEDEDPGEAALLRQKFQSAYDAAEGRFRELHEKYQVQRQAGWGQYVAKQREDMLRRIPEWQDNAVLAREREAIDKLVEPYGFTKQDMDAVVDPRFSQLLRDYMLLKSKFDAAVKNHQQVKQRGNKVLRTTVRVKPGTRLQRTEERAKQPGASRQEKHEAQKALLQQAGFL